MDALPPVTLDGLMLTRARAAGEIANDAVFEVPLRVAVILATVEALTELVVIVKVADVLPAFTSTVEGTEAEEIELESDTALPVAPAGPESVTVPVEVPPPPILVGSRFNEVRITGLMVKFAVFPSALPPAVRIAVV